MEENICQWYNWNGISIQNIQPTDSEKTTNQIKKWAEDATFFSTKEDIQYIIITWKDTQHH